jgi:hypothetical protein
LGRRRRTQQGWSPVVLELRGFAFELDPAVDHGGGAIGDLDRLVEVLLGHQDGQAASTFIDNIRLVSARRRLRRASPSVAYGPPKRKQ